MFDSVVSKDDFYGDSPRTFFLKNLKRTYTEQEKSATKPDNLEIKESALQKKQREYREEMNQSYRESGIWPKPITDRRLPGGANGWVFPDGKEGVWLPPDDYTGQRHTDTSITPINTDEPKESDFETDEEYLAAYRDYAFKL